MASKPASSTPRPPAGPPVAYSYLRFSSHGQADGDTVRRQTANPEEWCRRNGVRLDTTLVFEDRARSAFKVHHRHREALSEFRRNVTEGRIRPGSYLIIENLDRLSREQERIAVELLLSIVNAGITVVQLMPEEQVFGPANLDMLGLMRAVIQMAQAHQESAKKAKRLGEVWEQKRRAAVAGTGTLTARVPGWVDLADGRMRLNAARAAVVRRIFKLCVQGFGGQAIARRLNEEGVPTLTGRGKWYQSAVTYVLRSRAVLGEHQPHTEHGVGGRVAVGDPIPNYYPAAVTEELFNAAQGAMAGRVTRAGRPPARRANLFRGLLRDARGGGRLGILSRVKGPHRSVVYSNMDRKAGVPQHSFPAEAFEAAVLSKLREVDPREVIGESAAAERVLALTGERAELAGKLARLGDLLGDEPSPTIAGRVREAEAALRALDDRLAAARQEAATPLADSWGELPGLADAAGRPDGRVRLAATLRRVVDSIWCLFLPAGENRVAAVQVWFAGGRHRDYLITSRPARRGPGGGRRAPSWSVRALAAPGLPGGLDLRRRDDAGALETFLGAIDPEELARPETEGDG